MDMFEKRKTVDDYQYLVLIFFKKQLFNLSDKESDY